MFQGLGCSPIKAVRELGSERRETVRSISGVGVRALRGPFPSRRALILGWAYYLDAFSSYPLRTWLPSVYRWHDNWHTRGASFPVLSY